MTPNTRIGTLIRCCLLAAGTLCLALLTACGGGTKTPGAAAVDPAFTIQPALAAASDMSVTADREGVSPFIHFLTLSGHSLAGLQRVGYTIGAKPGAASAPVHLTYAVSALVQRGYYDGHIAITVPVVGLYAGYTNHVSLVLEFADGSSQPLKADIDTAAYVDANGIYDHPNVITRRAPGQALGFNYFAIKSYYGSPLIVDTDGEVRWWVPQTASGLTSTFAVDHFIMGDPNSAGLLRVGLDGTVASATLGLPGAIDFRHNLDPGKTGTIGTPDVTGGGITELESTAAEFDAGGSVIQSWDLAAIISQYMRDHGDDPSLFVRPGIDWFHMNSTAYDPTDDTLIASSRENFVIKLDYRTGNIVWILGDPTKYWATFPSLRAKAVKLADGSLYPIGQHGVSINSDGYLMLFDDGTPSLNQPAGAPSGQGRSYSSAVAYAIDPVTLQGHEAWRFDHGQTLYAAFCSSAYEGPDKSVLVDYADYDGVSPAHLTGLDAQHNIVFEFAYASRTGCGTAWNSIPIPLENLTVQ